jgi:hypothetical protein
MWEMADKAVPYVRARELNLLPKTYTYFRFHDARVKKTLK